LNNSVIKNRSAIKRLLRRTLQLSVILLGNADNSCAVERSVAREHDSSIEAG